MAGVQAISCLQSHDSDDSDGGQEEKSSNGKDRASLDDVTRGRSKQKIPLYVGCSQSSEPLGGSLKRSSNGCNWMLRPMKLVSLLFSSRVTNSSRAKKTTLVSQRKGTVNY